MTDIVPGAVFSGPYPFLRGTTELWDVDGPCKVKTWIPGHEYKMVSADDADAVADGVGRVIYTVVSTHKPAHYPERVFFVRQWEDPDGKRFGKKNLRIMTTPTFRRYAKGYRLEFRVGKQVFNEGAYI